MRDGASRDRDDNGRRRGLLESGSECRMRSEFSRCPPLNAIRILVR